MTDALRTWDTSKLTAASLARRFPDAAVTCNDRAPARRSDGLLGRPQVSLSATLSTYASYLTSSAAAPQAPPLYLNGWRAIQSHPRLASEMSAPYFMEGVDHTDAILTQLDLQLFKKAASGGGGGAGGAAGGATWWRGISAALWKLFIGPAGTVTRLHVDAADAHGWLAQVEGHKLFILYPPSCTEALRPMEEEKETMQSELDPLDEAAAAAGVSCYAALLKPGEAILVPRGWWHFALALTPSTTAQANFYEASTNAAALVTFVLAKVAPLMKAKR